VKPIAMTQCLSRNEVKSLSYRIMPTDVKFIAKISLGVRNAE